MRNSNPSEWNQTESGGGRTTNDGSNRGKDTNQQKCPAGKGSVENKEWNASLAQKGREGGENASPRGQWGMWGGITWWNGRGLSQTAGTDSLRMCENEKMEKWDAEKHVGQCINHPKVHARNMCAKKQLKKLGGDRMPRSRGTLGDAGT